MKRFPSGAAAAYGIKARLLFSIRSLRLSAAWVAGSFMAMFLLFSIAIHAFAYRLISLPPVKGSATIARELVRRHPERFVREMQQALRHHPPGRTSVQSW